MGGVGWGSKQRFGEGFGRSSEVCSVVALRSGMDWGPEDEKKRCGGWLGPEKWVTVGIRASQEVD